MFRGQSLLGSPQAGPLPSVLFWSPPEPNISEARAAVGGLHARPLCARAGRGLFSERTIEREDSPGKMATAGSADRPGRAASPAAGRSRLGFRAKSGSSPPKNEAKKCAGCVAGSPPGGRPACALCLPGRHSGSERLRKRSDPERSSGRTGRRDGDGWRGWCLYRGKPKPPFPFMSTTSRCLYNRPTARKREGTETEQGSV